MFINEVITNPVLVEGRKFVERTISSKFNKGDISITTTYMDGKPLIKRYTLCGKDTMKNVWKTVGQSNKIDILG